MPASSDIKASFLLSDQLPDQRSGTSVTARPDEQLAPNRPICSVLLPCIDRRELSEAEGACTIGPLTDGTTVAGIAQCAMRGSRSLTENDSVGCSGMTCRFTVSTSPSTQSSVIFPPLVVKNAAPVQRISRPVGSTPKNFARCAPRKLIRTAARSSAAIISSIVQTKFASAACTERI